MRIGWCGKVLIGVFLTGIGALILLYSRRTQLLSWYGRWLVGDVRTTPTWEVLFVLSGRPFERGVEAAAYWKSHATPIYLTGGLANDNLLAAGCGIYTECEMTRHVLLQHCVPDSAIHPVCEGSSTYEEILLIRRLCQSQGYRRVAVVSSAFHGRRIQLLARRYLASCGVETQFLPAKPLLFGLEKWWLSEYGFLNAFEETLKLLYYRIRGIL